MVGFYKRIDYVFKREIPNFSKETWQQAKLLETGFVYNECELICACASVQLIKAKWFVLNAAQ